MIKLTSDDKSEKSSVYSIGQTTFWGLIKVRSDNKSEQSSVYPATIFNLIRRQVKPHILNSKVHISEFHHFYIEWIDVSEDIDTN